jgi:hypothetical protein
MALQSIVPIVSITIQSATNLVSFSGIPNTYRDLILVCNVIGVGSILDSDYMKFNGSTSDFNNVQIYGNGSAAASNAGSSGRISNYENTIGRTYSSIVNIFDYSTTDRQKSYVSKYNSDDAGTGAFAGRWAQLAAVNAIDIYPQSGNYAIGSTFNLYGRIA